MDHKLMCKYLNIADSYFNGKDVKTKIINKDPTINGFCNNGVCKTNEDGINALIAYIIMNFKWSIKDEEYNKYDEYLLMWLSDKLFKIHNESKDKDNEITLNKAYDTYLKNHKVKFNYWTLFYNIESLKEANLWYMSEFYKLLDKICKTITDYEKNRDEITNLITNSTECSNQYISIYNDIHKCRSYRDLLNKLKGIYDDFRNYAIKETDSKINLETNLKKFTKPGGGEMDAVRGFKSYKFNHSNCKSLHKKITTSKPTDPPGLPSSSEEIQPPQPLKQLKDNQRETSQPYLSKQELKNDQTISDIPPEGVSGSEQDNSDSAPVGKENQSTPREPFNTGSFIFRNSLKGIDQLNNGLKFYEKKKEQLTNAKDTIKNLYNTSVSNVKKFFEKFSDFFNDIIDNVSKDYKKVENPPDSGDNQSGSDGTGDTPPTPNGPSSPKKDSEQTQNPPQNSPSFTEQNETDKSSEESSGNQDSDQNDKGPQKTVEGSVIKKEDPVNEVKGNGTIGIDDIFIFKEFKKIGIPIIVIIISITLAIMYKFLVFERRKKLKRKKMKKSTNLFGVNKTT
ncbi:CIR protein PIR protein [Plasmodium vinckei vinckei]|uniref:CIR protein PIR protein n=1 Tax=Plasmodium vinckei vinckei TaxID=54757 RepID=A0A449BUN4_PLAVN|nr:CIR protein PIR protein [Plasmodium vinckei vinckei]VEV57123.1 CIR protein PIR protein [Plasmodium vinckei vinckei]